MAQRRNPNGAGAPHTLSEDKLNTLLDIIENKRPRSVRDLAIKAGFPLRTVDRWYNKGAEEYEQSNNSPCCQLWHKFEQMKLAIKYELLAKLGKSTKIQASIWLLENEYRKEYGKDSEYINEIIENVNKLASKTKKKADE